jgi:hypothetical protein
MSYGPHTADVQDLVDFIHSGQLLRNPRPPRDADLKIIRDLSKAQAYREPAEDAPDDADLWDWQDIVDFGGICGSSLPSEKLQRLDPELIDRLNRLYDGEILDSLRRQLSGRCSEESISNLWADFTFILGYRAALGRSVPFIERLIELYRLGGYPCGWEGLHPAGRMVVYFPPE